MYPLCYVRTHCHALLQELNTVAARGLASVLLPCQSRSIAPSSGSSGGDRGARPSSGRSTAGHGLSSASSVQSQEQDVASQLPLSPVSDLTCHLFSHPRYVLANT